MLQKGRKTEDIFEEFENFIQSHELVAKAPSILNRDGPLGSFVPRGFQPDDLTIPLASTGLFYFTFKM